MNGIMFTAWQCGHGMPGLVVIGTRALNVTEQAPQVIVNFGPDPHSWAIDMFQP